MVQAIDAHGPFNLTTHVIYLTILFRKDGIQALDMNILLGDLSCREVQQLSSEERKRDQWIREKGAFP